MRRYLAILLAALTILSAFPAMTAFAWDKPAYDRTVTNTVENARQAQLLLPLWDNPHMQPYQDYISPFNFDETKYAPGKITGRLPMLGFNTWNHFGSAITENIIMEIADSFIRLGLDKVGYQYVGIDDGCYERTRQRGPNGELIPDPTYFPSGFKMLADYCHTRGLKLAMYNDVGYNTCNGMCQSSWGHEDQDAMSYAEWGVDYVKYDFCNNPWNGAPNIAAPNIRNVRVTGDGGFSATVNAYTVGVISAGRISNPGITASSVTRNTAGYINGSTLTTNTGVNGTTGDVTVTVNAPAAGTYNLSVEYAVANATTNRWLQVDVNGKRVIDGKQDPTGSATTFVYGAPVAVQLNAGDNAIRIYCEKRREVGMEQYAAFFDGLVKAREATGQDIIFSLCEWGNTQPWLWAWKVGDSWRTTGDIGSSWSSMVGIYSQNVLLDDYAGLDRGWNDPDMLEVGNGSSSFVPANFKENESHFNLWSIMNSPMLLGNDIRTVDVGDDVWQVIINKDIIDLNQDPLGIQAKRIKIDSINTTTGQVDPSVQRDPRVYFGGTGNYNRIDYLAKPLANGDLSMIMVNLSDRTTTTRGSFTIDELLNGTSAYHVGIRSKMVNIAKFESAQYYKISDLGARSKGAFIISKDTPITADLLGHASKTYKISPVTTTDYGLQLASNGDLNTSYILVNDSNAPLNAILVKTAYDEKGVLRSADTSTVITVGPLASVLGSATIAENLKPMWTYKAFLWDAATYIPLTDSLVHAVPGANRTVLTAALRTASGFNLDSYSRLSAFAVKEALIAANAVHDSFNPTQSEIDAAAAALLAATGGLTIDLSIYSKITGTMYGASGTYGSGRTYNMIFDGNIDTFYDAADGDNGYGGYDLGAGNESNVDLIRYYPRVNGNYQSRANGCTFRASNTESSGGRVGTVLHTISNCSASQWYVATPSDTTTKFRYIWFQSGSGSWGNIGEVEFYVKNGFDKTLLNNRVAFAQSLAAGDYTPASWAVVQAALSSAAALPGDANQAQIDAACDALMAALAQLVGV